MSQLTIEAAIALLESRLDAVPMLQRPTLLTLLPVPGSLGVAALTNAKPDDPDGLLIEAAGRPTPIMQMVVHLRAMLGAGDVNAAYAFPGSITAEELAVGKVPKSHRMTPRSLLFIRGPGRTEQVEAEVGGVKRMVGRYVPDPIVPVEAL